MQPEPNRNCELCPRLAEFRRDNTLAHPSWFNAPVESFGDTRARLLIVGLAPGLQGANKTGRPFTGDYAGDLLYATLEKFGFSRGLYGASIDDGLELADCMITNAVRCVPPQNKPTGAEIATCRPFLTQRISELPHLACILALGRIAHDSTLTALGQKRAQYRFVHAAEHVIPGETFRLYDSYHCSRYNTNTGRLTTEMFEDVFRKIVTRLERT